MAPGGEFRLKYLRVIQVEVSGKLLDLFSKKIFYNSESDRPGRIEKERKGNTTKHDRSSNT